jgi:hypothetical protein
LIPEQKAERQVRELQEKEEEGPGISAGLVCALLIPICCWDLDVGLVEPFYVIVMKSYESEEF